MIRSLFQICRALRGAVPEPLELVAELGVLPPAGHHASDRGGPRHAGADPEARLQEPVCNDRPFSHQGLPPHQPLLHRHRVLAMQLQHTHICSTRRCERLASLGVVVGEDLLRNDLRHIAGQFPGSKRAYRKLLQYRQAFRLAASVDGLFPADALLLIQIHREHSLSLAGETAALLHRDLLRFSESSIGRAALRGRRVPSLRRIRRWIESAKRASRGNGETANARKSVQSASRANAMAAA
ncbi:MAG: DUF4332 domain-containing protein [Planctomycetota bacterium]